MVCGRLFSTLFQNISFQPGLFLSFIQEFLERSIFFTSLLHLPWPLLDIQGTIISFGNVHKVVNWKSKRFKMFEICMFHSTVISIHMLVQTRMILVQNSNVPGVTCVLTERYRNWISWYLDVSPSWCQHFQYLGFLTGAPATNFALKRVKTRYDPLPRNEKLCGNL